MHEDQPYTDEELTQAWQEYAEKRKVFQAEYHLLSQPYDRRDHQIIIHLHNPIQETLLNTIKSDMAAFLREKLKNNQLTITGELKEDDDGKKVMYTDREKFEFLQEKNPMLKELKDRLGLDTDF